MRYLILLLAAYLLNIPASTAQLLIRNTQVLDVENKKILSGYDVMVQDGKIISITKGKKLNPAAGTLEIDGTNQWLMPGLADAHVHFFQSGGLYTRPDAIDLRKYRPYAEEIKWSHEHFEELLRMYLSAGITSVTDVGATINLLQQRDSFANKTYAPLIQMTGPLITTWLPPQFKNLGKDAPFVEIKTEQEARKAVQDQLPYHPDFIKIWYIVTDPNVEAGARKNIAMVKAVIDEAHANGKRVAVHAMERITAQLAVEAGADYLVHNTDDGVIDDSFIQLLKEHKTVLCPTLVVGKNYEKVLSHQYQFSTFELNRAHPFTVSTILDYPWPDTSLAKQVTGFFKSPLMQARQKTSDSISVVNLKKLSDAGVTIATGTDAGNIGTQHMTSYFDELQAMSAAGLTNWQVLQSSTLNPAVAMGQEKLWGSIAVNKTANMILLGANPLDSLENLKKINFVINKGQVIRPDTFLHASPVMLVQKQLNAYNARNLEAFLEPYADEVEIGKVGGKTEKMNKDKLKSDYSFINTVKYLYCRILNRIVVGNTVIDQEEVWLSPKPENLIHAAAVYLIRNGKIVKVLFSE